MKILILNAEETYFGGAQVLLGNFLNELRAQGEEVIFGFVQGTRTAELAPAGMEAIFLPPKGDFSISGCWAQARGVKRALRGRGLDVVHGWHARDWELAALVGWLLGKPGVGTLHDHPQASFISSKRRVLMRWSARLGLKKLACVSEAVRSACQIAGYPPAKLALIHNGIPLAENAPARRPSNAIRFGFAGVFSERKGLAGLFEMIDHFAEKIPAGWELHLAGEAQDEPGRQLLGSIRQRYANRPWWARVVWRGWEPQAREFFSEIDLLICPSSQFEPFGLVACEAGQAGVPALAARIGGLPEIIVDSETGWLFDAGRWQSGAQVLRRIVESRAQIQAAGRRAQARIRAEFGMPKMVAAYREFYSSVSHNG